jgi:hypothetical protein
MSNMVNKKKAAICVGCYLLDTLAAPSSSLYAKNDRSAAFLNAAEE